MKILIVPDIHQRYQQIPSLIQKEQNNHDLIVFLGDYFDNSIFDLETVRQTALTIKEFTTHPSVKMLMGNHDLPYRFWSACPKLRCSGNTLESSEIISNILKREDWERMHLFHHETDKRNREWIFSHAGLSPFFERPFIGINKDVLAVDCHAALENCKIGVVCPLLRAGLSRGGNETVGGITWLDWNHEFTPIPNINQIVGHTTLRHPAAKIIKGSVNWNLDTKSQYLIKWVDGKVEVIQNKYL